MLFSMVCTDDNGNVVDMRTDQPTQPEAMGLEPTLFGFHHDRDVDINSDSSTNTEIQTSIQSFSSSGSGPSDDNDKVLPYCDKVNGQRDKYPDCFDRQDYDDSTGLASCNDGSLERDHHDCNDAFDYGDNDESGNDNNDGEDDAEEPLRVEEIDDNLAEAMD